MTNAVVASEIPTLVEQQAEAPDILSLDCFDTLIWRNVNMPVDIFHDLDIPGANMEMRVRAENRARKALILNSDSSEVTIKDIYSNMFRDADETVVSECIAKELQAEARHCFAFSPVCDLIRDAKKRGMKVIIVSDTYLPEPLLRQLISDAAGNEILDMIDQIFCSCEYGASKSAGLFKHVLAELGVSPHKILHLGDNKKADQEAPEKLGVRGIHFRQFDEEAEERLRLEANASTLLESDSRRDSPVFQPHRAAISLRNNDDTVFQFGHDVLGPVFQGFSQWVADEADALEESSGKKPKLLFMLRDGFLPAQAFLKAFPDRAEDVSMVEISRFTANAASFSSKAAIKSYLMSEATGNKDDAYSQQRQAAYCRQLLFFDNEIRTLAKIRKPEDFVREVLKTKNVKKITARSKKFAGRLCAHMRQAGVENGDTIMFVDLGYNGSAQNVVEPVLNEAMNLTIAGRYLLLRELMITGLDKKGLIDHRHYDNSALNAMCESIAVLEQLSTQAQGSVLGYEDDGTPRRDSADIKGRQSDAREQAQAACLSYMDDPECGWETVPRSWNGDCARRMAAASLTRLLFLPVRREVGIFESFHHDVNLGTRDMVRLVDPQAAAKGIRRRGLFYTKNTTRIYLPGELQQQGMQALLPNFASNRFALDLRQKDFQAEALTLPVVLADDKEHVQVDIEAHPTSDGYYQALIPAGMGSYNIAVMIGQVCDWLQIDDVSFHEVDNFSAKKLDDDTIPAYPVFESVVEKAPGLLACTAPDAFIMIPPSSISTGGQMMLSLVFRPTILRETSAATLKEVA
ncbi:hypothetical protein SAMN02745824_2157 [Parasphingorhabdus marina DSM 22363]|uniref:Haloacid dehalogenase-like hydrolase n=1 Tax=Parasphingorhabdus marina DSM 22363 TaxID=1123272 RepID=A0A1N6EZ92_9SPHN|nr:HAD family hydrolase [Parasphingorhabdus marina]SIN88342.1 hypothetical protein SAMN02745824_2157 [Parasphingorhabdus marina DSM 22363]